MESKVIEIKNGIFYTGVKDKDIRTFDIIMHTAYGTSYNSYIVKGSEKTALIEAAKDKFSDIFLENVRLITPIEKIDYLIINHTEPDHTGNIAELLNINPEMVIVGTSIAVNFLKQIVNKPFDCIIVKDGTVLSLGDKTMNFFPLPNLHWPDTMFTHIPEDNILFTCDAFGAHYTFDSILDSSLTDCQRADYNGAVEYYFDMILGPFKNPCVINALSVVEKLKPDIIATGHGPVLDSEVSNILEKYRKWCSHTKSDKKIVVIAYVSAYGYTKILSSQIEKAISKSGEIEVKRFDLENHSTSDVLAEIEYADGLLLGSPTIVADALKPVWDLVSSMHSPIHGKKIAAAFGSYGWSGEAVPNLTERLKQLKMKTLDGFRVRLKPTDDDLNKAFEFGTTFAQTILSKT